VAILGPTNLPSEAPTHASQMFSNNVTKFLLNLARDGQLALDLDDQIIRDTLVAYQGEVFNDRLRGMLGLQPLASPNASGDRADGPDTADNDIQSRG
jgi:NAD(P) transhydrogenase subunit alpha